MYTGNHFKVYALKQYIINQFTSPPYFETLRLENQNSFFRQNITFQ